MKKSPFQFARNYYHTTTVTQQQEQAPTKAKATRRQAKTTNKQDAAAAAADKKVKQWPHGHKYRICVVGAGPAGFYTAHRILKKAPQDNIECIDFIEQYPFPGGLVRYGVAPDHADTKNVMSTFEAIMDNDKVGFYGNVKITENETANDTNISKPTCIPMEKLRSIFDVVVVSHGADSNRHVFDDAYYSKDSQFAGKLHPAREFVAWYNSHPEHKNDEFPLEQFEHVCIIGQGNVAIDVARVLLKHPGM